jgi:hypothetical protein
MAGGWQPWQVVLAVGATLCAAATAAPPPPLASIVEEVLGMRIGLMDGPPTAVFPTGPSSGGGPSGTRNPAVPPGQSFNTTLAHGLASGAITQQQVDSLCQLRLGVYSYYWAVVGDPGTAVSWRQCPHSRSTVTRVFRCP